MDAFKKCIRKNFTKCEDNSLSVRYLKGSNTKMRKLFQKKKDLMRNIAPVKCINLSSQKKYINIPCEVQLLRHFFLQFVELIIQYGKRRTTIADRAIATANRFGRNQL